jgi:hypothetical protein
MPVLDPVVNLVSVEIGEQQNHSGNRSEDGHRIIFLITELGALMVNRYVPGIRPIMDTVRKVLSFIRLSPGDKTDILREAGIKTKSKSWPCVRGEEIKLV